MRVDCPDPVPSLPHTPIHRDDNATGGLSSNFQQWHVFVRIVPTLDGVHVGELGSAMQGEVPIRIDRLLDSEGVAYDLKNSFFNMPPNLRIWAGATVDPANLEALVPWIEWAYAKVKEEIVAEA